MKYDKRNTLCISSQAGCAMACSFCATGQAGFDRHLTSGEIIEQVMLATNLSKSKISNIVFMGMGEPLANTKNVYEACSKLVNDMNLSARHITVSTVGIVPGMNEMAKWDLPLTLAVSLHSPFNDKRSEIIPINKRYPIQQVLDAACVVSKAHNRRVSFEYTAIENVNIDNNHAHSLGKLLSEYEGVGGAHLNIIPLNTTSKFSGKTASNDQIKKFSETVAHHGISVSIRKNRGNDIDAACGQLRERHENAN
jgi:23S rRNA (adenine2503-C2)-methyltransferase